VGEDKDEMVTSPLAFWGAFPFCRGGFGGVRPGAGADGEGRTSGALRSATTGAARGGGCEAARWLPGMRFRSERRRHESPRRG
jgi:hypothetical protein